jgi:hypothetical protein
MRYPVADGGKGYALTFYYIMYDMAHRQFGGLSKLKPPYPVIPACPESFLFQCVTKKQPIPDKRDDTFYEPETGQ